MQMTRRFLSMILAVAMICGMLTGITISASAVSVSGSFVKYTAEADGTIAEGDYLVVYNGKAMKAAVVSGRLSYAEVTAENDAIANPERLWSGTSRQATPITPCITPRLNPMRRAPA